MEPQSAEDPLAPLNITRTSSTRNSLLGKRRACSHLDRYEWLFLGIVSLTLAGVLAITLYRLFLLPTATSEFTLAVLVLFNILFCYIYAFHGVFYEQPNEIYFLVLSTVIILVYSVVGYHVGEIQDSVKTGKLMYTCFVGPIIVILGFQIGCHYRVSGNLLFRTVGGDPYMQIICRRAQLQCVLLLFDAQLMYSAILLVIHAVGINLVQELLVLILGSIFTLIWILIGYLMVRCESLIAMAAFLTLSVVQPSYIIWRLSTAGVHQQDLLGKTILQVSASFFLFVHAYLVGNTVRVYQNFGKGLKEKIFGDTRSTSQYGAIPDILT
ncbi:uncharacterized protein LOC124159102 [Ischnura elegans]|uniref:uncharacterized protein LOC124159102 n=1 Tax=Ischnura elegans TaxID=197161 RepID=UPI001ED899B6|nr:uncharacterized protein LOC124159102 [Ischnura elegans]XP_046390607.1 uncharacterized protein LOC124159102 [Ischnura elegans]